MSSYFDIQIHQDLLATSVFLGGAVLLLGFALASYAGLLSSRPLRRATYYAGKHVLITGGSSGIGRELASVLIQAGASVTLVARNHHRLRLAAEELAPPGEINAAAARVNTAIADCADPTSVESMVEDVEDKFGPVDILVNSAGCAIGAYFDTMDAALLRNQMDSNYFSQAYPAHALFHRMAKRRSGHIVFISSMSGLTGVFGQAAYVASKFATRGLTEALYYEGRPFGINVTVIYPPDTDTPGLRNERSTMPPETLKISETGGFFSAEVVAKRIADGIMKKQFRVSIGFIGRLLGILTAGPTPGASIAEVFVLPLARAINPLFIWDQNRIIRKGHALRFSSSKIDSQPDSSDKSTATYQNVSAKLPR